MPSKDFLEEVKKAFDLMEQEAELMDRRAGNLITVSGTVATLLFVFGSYLLSNIVSDYYLRNYMFYTLALGIIAALFSLLWSLLLSYRGIKYVMPLGATIFFKQNGRLDEDMVKRFESASEEDFLQRMVEDYLHSLKFNSDANSDKAQKLQISEWSLFASILLIMVLVVFLGMALHDDKIVIKSLIGS